MPPETNAPGAGELRYDVTLPATPLSVAQARHAVARFGESHHADPEKIALGVSEAVSNAVLHAYREPSGPVEIEARVQDDAVLVAVHDHGMGMGADMHSPGLHLGLSLMKAVAERVSIESTGGGVRVEMQFPCRTDETRH